MWWQLWKTYRCHRCAWEKHMLLSSQTRAGCTHLASTTRASVAESLLLQELLREMVSMCFLETCLCNQCYWWDQFHGTLSSIGNMSFVFLVNYGLGEALYSWISRLVRKDCYSCTLDSSIGAHFSFSVSSSVYSNWLYPFFVTWLSCSWWIVQFFFFFCCFMFHPQLCHFWTTTLIHSCRWSPLFDQLLL